MASTEDDHRTIVVPPSIDRRNSKTSLLAPSTGSERFQESVHLIPSRPTYPKSTFKSYMTGLVKKKKGEPERFDPLIMKLPFIIGTPLFLLALGVALEAGIIVSEQQGGFPVPIENKLGFIGSTQFLLSIAPLPLIIPAVFLYRELDWMIRYYQPYIVLSNGRAEAEETLLLDYVAIGTFWGILYALKFRHRTVLLSCLTATATFLLQPLASSIFAVSTAPHKSQESVTSVNTLGLSPDFNTLSSFVAAAGFVDAAVVHELPDPPFIHEGWATAEFTFPPPALNGSMAVTTTGIQSKPNCERPTGGVSVGDAGDGNFTLTATSSRGCDHIARFNPDDAVSQYGVISAPCGEYEGKSINFQPVMFWFVNEASGSYESISQADAIFCYPKIDVFRVRAEANLNNGALANCSIVDDYPAANNVTGPPLNGDTFNGVLFDETDMNTFVRARSSATRTGVSGAIFKAAQRKPEGPGSTFDLPNGFLDLTSKIYQQHLAVSAKSVYFLSQNSTLNSLEEAYVPRLFINPVPGHSLAVLLFTIGLVGLILHISSRRARRGLALGAPPGTIAHTVALTAHSGFGELLFPYDTAKEIKEKLKGLKFTLDKRTGAIVADEDMYEIDRLASEDGATTPKDWPKSPMPGTPKSRDGLMQYPPPPSSGVHYMNPSESSMELSSTRAAAFYAANGGGGRDVVNTRGGGGAYRTPYDG